MSDSCDITETEVKGITTEMDDHNMDSKIRLRPEQMEAVAATQAQRNYIQILKGPAGSGKSTAMTAIIQVALQAGLNILVVSETHAAANNCYDKLEGAAKQQKIARHDPMFPLRLHSMHYEKEYLKNPESQATHSRDLVLNLKRDHDAHRFANPESGLAAAANCGLLPLVIKKFPKFRLKDEPRQRPAGLHKAEDLDFTNESHRKYLREVIDPGNFVNMQDKMKHYLDRYRKWHAAIDEKAKESLRPTERETKRGNYAINAVFKSILEHKRLIITTANNCYSEILKSSIAKNIDPKKGLLLVVDEASMMTDASLSALLTQVITAERIESEFRGINPIKSVILVGDPKQLAPQNQYSDYTEFHPEYTLFKRLCDSGHPSTEFRDQVRMQYAIGKWVDENYYGDSLNHGAPLTSLDEPSSAFLNGGRELQKHMFTLLGNVIDGKDGKKLRQPLTQEAFNICADKTDAGARSEIDAFCRLWLIDVSDGMALKEPGGSVFNLVNTIYVTEFLLQLVLGTDYRQALNEGRKPDHFFQWSDIVILVPYSAQQAHYRARLNQIAADIGIDRVLQVKVSTIHSFASQEAKIVLLDYVHDSLSGTVGHLAQSDVSLVAHTRAKEFLFVFADSKIPKKARTDRDWQDTDRAGKPFVANYVAPAVRLIEDLVKANLMTKAFAVDEDCVAEVTSKEAIERYAGMDSFDASGDLVDRMYHPSTLKRLEGI